MAWVSAEGKRQRELVKDPDIPTLHRHRGHGGGGTDTATQTDTEGEHGGAGGGRQLLGYTWELLRNSWNEVSLKEGKVAS